MKEEAHLSFAEHGGIHAAQIREATHLDLDDIMSVEVRSFTTPWSRDAMAQEIDRGDWSRVMVSVMHGELVGFMVYWIVVNELHLLNLAVRPDCRRQGIGRAMVKHLVELADDSGLASLFLEVRVSNTSAQHLYRQFGFEPIAIRQNYYSDDGEDAIVMSLRRNQ